LSLELYKQTIEMRGIVLYKVTGIPAYKAQVLIISGSLNLGDSQEIFTNSKGTFNMTLPNNVSYKIQAKKDDQESHVYYIPKWQKSAYITLEI
jgi:hypothetical protein